MTSQLISQSSEPAILIVDDNPQNLQVLGKILQENKYEIEFAINGEAALVWLKKRQFDLILLDINMPGMNGFEVCRKIRSNPVMNNVPVIFLSADTDRESILKGFEFGAQDYVSKPFDSRELLARVRTHLALKNSHEKLEKLNKSLEEKVAERTQQLKESNEKLEATNIKLFDLDRAKTDFLNLISHEIRTPLNGISGPLKLLKEPVSASEIGELVEILDMSVKRLERFSLNALLITRLKIKQFEIRKDKIHLSNLINEVLKEEKEKFQARNIHVKRNDEITLGLISGEAELIKKCISNILDNAVRFSPDNSTIEIDTYVEEQTIICEINDNGKGFATGTIDRVFELFTTGDECKDNSIGIGLPIAKMIMEGHGGSIIVGNNSGGGASVKLLFQTNVVD
ncbi:MAG TPA: response regulator [Bacteroidales bacterium]|nr:response regulator [Bacteroidales bacterium]